MLNRQPKPATVVEKILGYFASQSLGSLIAHASAMLLAIGVVDYVTGDELNVEILYLLPITIMTWAAGRTIGMATAFAAGSVWWLTDFLLGHEYSHPLYFLFDWVNLLATFCLLVVIISKLKQALSKTGLELHRSDGRYQTLVSALPHGICEMDLSGKITFANPAFQQLMGYPERDLHAKTIYDFIPSDAEHEQAKRVMQERPESQAMPTPYFARMKKKDGTLADIQVDWVYKRNEQQVVTGFTSVITDITERRLAEDTARRQREKLELTSRLIAANEIASTLAHELNQPLAAIANYNTGCVRRLRSGKWSVDELMAVMEKSSVQAERAGGIIRRVRELVNKREPRRVPGCLDEIISDLVGLVEPELEKGGIRLVLDLAANLPAVLIDRSMIEQVVLNLLKNAREAMGNTPPADRKILVRTVMNGSDEVEVSIRDYGQGLPEELRQNLIVPFFTTKPLGMGIGLNICRSIIEFHGGKLWAVTHSEGGTTFSFTLSMAGH